MGAQNGGVGRGLMPHSSQDSPRSQVVKAVGFQPTIRKFDSCRGDQMSGVAE